MGFAHAASGKTIILADLHRCGLRHAARAPVRMRLHNRADLRRSGSSVIAAQDNAK
jgi:hypothetical protein